MWWKDRPLHWPTGPLHNNGNSENVAPTALHYVLQPSKVQQHYWGEVWNTIHISFSEPADQGKISLCHVSDYWAPAVYAHLLQQEKCLHRGSKHVILIYFYCTVKRRSEEAAFTMKQYRVYRVDLKLQHKLYETVKNPICLEPPEKSTLFFLTIQLCSQAQKNLLSVQTDLWSEWSSTVSSDWQWLSKVLGRNLPPCELFNRQCLWLNLAPLECNAMASRELSHF